MIFKRLITAPRALPTILLLVFALLGSLLWIAFMFFRMPAPAAAPGVLAASAPMADIAPEAGPRRFVSDAARVYLEQTRDGQSLMQAVTAASFGLKREAHSPFDKKSGAGYLAMSHDQNLNAWFDKDGITVRPTLSEKERSHSWQLGFRLRSYGYGSQLMSAAPIVSRQVKGNRIEYERGAGETGERVIEWYENQSAGIEQGFTLSARPVRGGEVGVDEPLRLVVAVTGDLRARAKDEGQAIELSKKSGEGALSYSRLTALDANGKKLAAQMEPSADGREIALVVDDREAVYPLVIDPITASLERELDGFQTDSRFGFAVAIDGNVAAVGAWRQDTFIGGFTSPDAGVVYIFSRSGTTWSQVQTFSGSSSNATWGFSVAVNNNRVVVGCPGQQSQKGAAFLYDISANTIKEITQAARPLAAGDQFGYSVAISGTDIVVSAPFVDDSASVPDTGRVYTFIANSDGTVSERDNISDNVAGANSQLGAAVAIDGLNIILGAPGSGAGQAQIWTLNPVNRFLATRTRIQASDGEAGDQFGNSVDISGNTAVVGAYGDDDRGTDAGAAYVFVGNASGQWSQQQKLTFNGSRANDHFSQHAVAINGNTIVVGADEWDFFPDDNAGAVYVFTRNGTVWTRQTELQGASAYNYGIGVDISGNSIIIGARGADAPGIPRAGTAYVYRLDCVPPAGSSAFFDPPFLARPTTKAVCPGGSVEINVQLTAGGAPTGFQWRKNGVNIPGANSNSYTISSAAASDAGSYDVIVSNSCGSDISAPATLTVHSFNLNPTSQNFSASGSNGIVNVTATGSCPWTAVSNVPWITITSGASGNGSGTVGFTVAANTGPNQRIGSITIGDKTFTVSQDGLNCSYAITPTSQNVSSSGGTNSSVNVTATAGCAWTATSNDPVWLTISAGASGTGNGTVNYTVAANTGPARIGTLSIAGLTFTVTQASGCTFSISPASQSFPASAAVSAVNVATGGGCAWTAASNDSFITITSGNSGTGAGTVNYSAAANTGPQRTGTMTIAGLTFTVTQNAAAPSPTVQLAQNSYSVNESTGSIAILVNRAGDLSAAMSVNYTTTDNSDFLQNCNVTNGRATSRCDYISLVGTLHFASGENSKTLFLPIVDDTYLEGAETFFLSLSNATGGVAIGANQRATITLTDNGNDGIGLPNPIDDATFFVRQHYMDFLGREPDPSSSAWVAQINQCAPADQSCRLSVSQGIYGSPEFKDRGYFIYKFYSVAFGRKPTYDEFVLDRARVSGFQSDAELEQSKQDFIADFMSRPEFGGYNGLTNDQYVLTLFNISGVSQITVGGVVRNVSAMQQLMQGGRTRAQVLRDFAESPEVSARFQVESTIVMHYFGYLRRDPDAAYQDWINIYNQTGDSRNVTNGFVNSQEYRARFGP